MAADTLLCVLPLRLLPKDPPSMDHDMGLLAVIIHVAVIAACVEFSSADCQSEVTCPCGTSGLNITICLKHFSESEDVCQRWARCKRCHPNVKHCSECPAGYTGPTCSEEAGNELLARLKRQYRDARSGTLLRRRVPRSHGATLSDPNVLLYLEVMNIDCPIGPVPLYYLGYAVVYGCYSDYTRGKCTYLTCLTSGKRSDQKPPCQVFVPSSTAGDRTSSNGEALVLNAARRRCQCRNGGTCDSDGRCFCPAGTSGTKCEKSNSHCRLELTGHTNGSYDCTTEKNATVCHIQCDGRKLGNFYCIPGRSWEPELPYCVKVKGSTTVIDDYLKQCQCQNGGICDKDGRCLCPEGWSGASCEKRDETVVGAYDVQCQCQDGRVCDSRGRCVCPPGRTGPNCEKGDGTVIEANDVQCQCQDGRVCDSRGRCVCPPGRKGPNCEEASSEPESLYCIDPGFVENADRQSFPPLSTRQQGYLEGTRMSYTCKEGYQLQGEPTLFCMASGKWSSSTPTCDPIPRSEYCRDPGALANGYSLDISGVPTSSTATYRPGDIVWLYCNEGFSMEGPDSVTCLISGSWSKKPRCVRDTTDSRTTTTTTPGPENPTAEFCKNPGNIANGKVRVLRLLNQRRRPADNSEEHIPNTRIRYTCDESYLLKGAKEITCRANGIWSDEKPTCERVADTGNRCRDPGPILNGKVMINARQPIVEPSAEHIPGTTLYYECDKGYSLTGSTSITCESDGLWSAVTPSCVEESESYCPNPGPLANGQVVLNPARGQGRRQSTLSDDRFRKDTRLQFICNRGYKLIGRPYAICGPDEMWSTSFPHCEKIEDTGNRCRNPGPIQNGKVILNARRQTMQPSAEYIPGTTLYYECDNGYALTGSLSITCESDGFWSAVTPSCVEESESYCPNPGPLANGQVVLNPARGQGRRQSTLSDERFGKDTRLQFICDRGYKLIGLPYAICGPDEMWSTSFPHCEKIEDTGNRCRDPGPIQNGKVILNARRQVTQPSADYIPGTTLYYECDDGYTLTGSISITCESDGFWSAVTPSCVEESESYCPNPGPLANGQVVLNPARGQGRRQSTLSDERFSKDTRLQFICDRGYKLIGLPYAICGPDEMWSTSFPHCEKIEDTGNRCRDPGPIQNGKVILNARRQVMRPSAEYIPGTTLYYECDNGYALTGSISITCETDGFWSAVTPSCVEESESYCPNPGPLANGQVVLSPAQGSQSTLANDRFRKDTRLQFFCDAGFKLIGLPYAICGPDEMWSTSFPNCEKVEDTGNRCRDPGPIQNGKVILNARRQVMRPSADYIPGTTLYYECDDGYTLTGSISITCESDGFWSALTPSCVEESESYCPNPGPLANGQVVLSPAQGSQSTLANDRFRKDTRLQFFCDAGFKLIGLPYAICGPDEMWSTSFPNCEKVEDTGNRCRDPGPIQNGKVILNARRQVMRPSADYIPGTTLYYECDDGYTLTGSISITCESDGFWSALTPSCVEESESYCPNPGPLANGQVVLSPAQGSQSTLANDRFRKDTRLQFFCDAGFKLIGLPYAICGPDEMWSTSFPNCEKVEDTGNRCRDPGPIQNGKVILNARRQVMRPSADYIPGTTLYYECDDGYTLTGSISITCESDGFWSALTPSCVEESESYCPNPGPLANGQVVLSPAQGSQSTLANDRFRKDTRLQFFCDAGFKLIGLPYAICGPDEMWSTSFPNCEKVEDTGNRCRDPGPIQNGKVILNARRQVMRPSADYIPGTTLYYECDDGYTLTGSISITCESDGFWSALTPSCVEESESYCPNPGPLANGQVVLSPAQGSQSTLANDRFRKDTRLQFFCDAGFKLIGLPYAICGPDEMWSTSFPNCEKVEDTGNRCRDPGPIQNGKVILNARRQVMRPSADYIPGTTLYYECDDGYTLTGSISITCESDGFWSALTPSCVEESDSYCPNPGPLANGQVVLSPAQGSQSTLANDRFRKDTRLQFFCDAGFKLIGLPYAICGPDEMWSTSFPNCEKVEDTGNRCRDPGSILNGKVVLNARRQAMQPSAEYIPGTMLYYECDNGYTLTGSISITCESDGFWSAVTPSCVEESESYCPNPGPLANGQVVLSPAQGSQSTLTDNRFRKDTRLQFFCDAGYELIGLTYAICGPDEMWSTSFPYCEKSEDTGKFCRDPGSILNGKVTLLPPAGNARIPIVEPSAAYIQGTTLEYECDSGYTLTGSISITCENDGFWSAVTPSCIENSESYCPNPGPLTNGQVVLRPSRGQTRDPTVTDEKFREETRLEFYCDSGYKLIGLPFASCGPDEMWSTSFPYCEKENPTAEDRMYCDNPGEITNGNVQVTSIQNQRRRPFRPYGRPLPNPADNPQSYFRNTRLRYSCDESYTLNGAQEITCGGNGLWSAMKPTCQGECGKSKLFVTRTKRITNGKPTEAGQWPWMVAIATVLGGESSITCGGVLIDRRHILTSAHCFDNPGTFELYFGKHQRKATRDDDKVLKRTDFTVTIHPNYKSSTLESDIALVRFSPDIRFTARIQPICLPNANSTVEHLRRGRDGIVTGWGVTERGLPSETLHTATLPILPRDYCVRAYQRQGKMFPITSNMYCAGFERGGASACTGDSGSPMVFYDDFSERYTLEGLVSYGAKDECSEPERYTVVTKVLPYLPWIIRNQVIS